MRNFVKGGFRVVGESPCAPTYVKTTAGKEATNDETGGAWLTLFTCAGKGDGQRLVVVGREV